MSKKDFKDDTKVEAPNFLKQVHSKREPEDKPKYKVPPSGYVKTC